MTDRIEATFGFDRRLFRRALTAFWFSAVPRASFRWRVTFWTILWFALLAVIGGGTAQGVPWWQIGTVIGLGIGVVLVVLQRSRMGRFYDVLGEHWTRTGEMTTRFDALGMRVSQTGSEMRFDWPAVDAMVKIRGGTVFRVGMTMISVPDRALPGGMTGEAFRAQVASWRAA